MAINNRFDHTLSNSVCWIFKCNEKVEIIKTKGNNSWLRENKKLPSNSSELWESYISIRLTHDDNHKLIKKGLNVPLIKRLSIKTSLVNELMQRNTISNDELFEVASSDSSDFKDFKNNPLIAKNKESNEICRYINYLFQVNSILFTVLPT